MASRLKRHPTLERGSKLLLPGERSHASAEQMRRKGVRLDKAVVGALKHWCEKLGVRG